MDQVCRLKLGAALVLLCWFIGVVCLESFLFLLDSITVGSSLFLRSYACADLSLLLYGLTRLDFLSSCLDFAQLGSLLLIRSFV